MSETIKLHHYDYDTREMVEDGEVSTYQIAKCIKPEQMAELLDDLLNVGGRGYIEGLQVGKDLRTTHRTLQRSAIGFALGIILGISDQEHSDARNATALETAKKIADLAEKGELPLGLYI
jgi:hypothetical protein